MNNQAEQGGGNPSSADGAAAQDFLLELRCEEIPARMQKGARSELEKLFRKQMETAGVSLGQITTWSTPRRLALIARGLPTQTSSTCKETKGPRTSAPPQALDGFLRKTGLTQDQLEERGGIYYAVVKQPGMAIKDVLASAIPAIVRSFSWPKSMRWGAGSISTESLKWVRPLSGIVAIIGQDLVECDVDGIISSYATKGHRFHSPGNITIGGADDYAEKLRACHVIVDHSERETIIRSGAAKAAADAGMDLVQDEGLVIENAGLTEWPVPLLGRFEEDFLEVPPEVIQLTARINQKYFVCENAGVLANAFICTANIEAADGGAAIIDGNRKVLAARLSDARFFWDVDRKKNLAQHAAGLERITFHEKLGSVADKARRVAKLAEWLANEGIVADCDPALAQQAAELCKADLVTEMVGEFPELQGLMGGYYARAEGLGDAVADAIRDHYKPVGQGDEVPAAPVTIAISLADKLDTLIGFFVINERPTGSRDPFALRRAALGVLEILHRNQLRFSLSHVIEAGLAGFSPDLILDQAPDPELKDGQQQTGAKAVFTNLPNFFADRLKVQQREAGVRHDLIDAIFALGGEGDLVRLLARVNALQGFMDTQDGANLLAGYKRAANILKKEDWPSSSKTEEAALQTLDYTPEPAEKLLIEALATAQPKAVAAIDAEDFGAAMAALASLRAPIDAFFDEVTVNDDEENKRAARLGLLAQFRAAVQNAADFSKIEG